MRSQHDTTDLGYVETGLQPPFGQAGLPLTVSTIKRVRAEREDSGMRLPEDMTNEGTVVVHREPWDGDNVMVREGSHGNAPTHTHP